MARLGLVLDPAWPPLPAACFSLSSRLLFLPPLHLIPRQPNANVWLMRRTHTRSRARATYVSPRRRRPPPAPPRRPYSPPLLILLFFPLRRPRTQCATSRCLGVTVMTYSHMHVMSDIVPPSSSSYAATSLSPIVPTTNPPFTVTPTPIPYRNVLVLPLSLSVSLSRARRDQPVAAV